MERRGQSVAGWVMAVGLVGAAAFGLNLRSSANPDPSPQPSSDPMSSALPEPDEAVAWIGGPALTDGISPPERPSMQPTPIPPTPAPTPVPPPPAPPPPAPAPATGGAGGPLAPMTPPPGWTPPPAIPGDIWTSGAFGQSMSSGGLTVTVTRLAPGVDSSSCHPHAELPAGKMLYGFGVTVTWSGPSSLVYETHVPDQGHFTCWLNEPPPIVSGVTYHVFELVPEGSTPAWFRIHLFPNGSFPAQIFEFR